jgi:hypothetical protein
MDLRFKHAVKDFLPRSSILNLLLSLDLLRNTLCPPV